MNFIGQSVTEKLFTALFLSTSVAANFSFIYLKMSLLCVTAYSELFFGLEQTVMIQTMQYIKHIFFELKCSMQFEHLHFFKQPVK